MILLRAGLPANKRYVLFYDSATDPVPDKRNAGFAEALRNATLLERGSLCTVVDVSEYSPNELQEAFMEAVAVSVLKKYRIRQVVGSRRHSGWLFGKQVPALFVYERSSPRVVVQPGGSKKVILGHGYPDDVYPHDAGGIMVTIGDQLERFKKE